MRDDEPRPVWMCVFITAGPITKLFAGGEEESGGPMMCYETLDFGLWSVYFAVTLASTGPLKIFR
jgi:hypothetical protein